jgi:uncharacterized protein YbbC (DUF1343 family)
MHSITALLLILTLNAHTGTLSRRVSTGADKLLESSLSILQGKHVALVTNQTGRLSDGTFLVDTLVARRIDVVALFGPEHGIRGGAGAGEQVGDTTDPNTGIKVYSLFGQRTKPTREMLRGVDVLIYDIQDVGVRFYTYISTMKLTMEAAAEAGIPFVVLDRPNPHGGVHLDGPVIEDSLRSFVGSVPVPLIYGLTCGELAQMINGEGWLANGIRADLHVVSMEGWRRDMFWEDTQLPWVPPSPNIKTPASALVYPGTCLLEGTNISEGRGTTSPFQTVGAPFVNGGKLWAAMTGLNLKGVRFSATTFTPTSSKHIGQKCRGITIEVMDANAFEPMRVGLELIGVFQKLNPGELTIRESWFNRLIGQAKVLRLLKQGIEPEEIRRSWIPGLENFRRISGKYYLYPLR